MYGIKNILFMYGMLFEGRETIAASQSVGFHPLGNLFLNLLNTHAKKPFARHGHAFEKSLLASEKTSCLEMLLKESRKLTVKKRKFGAPGTMFMADVSVP